MVQTLGTLVKKHRFLGKARGECRVRNESVVSIPTSGLRLNSGRCGQNRGVMKRSDPWFCSTKPQGSEPKQSISPSARWLAKRMSLKNMGCAAFFAPEDHGGARESAKTLPSEIRQLIVDLHF